MLKKAMKANARFKKKCKKDGVKHSKIYLEERAASAKKTPPSEAAKELVKRHNQKGYG